MSFQSFFFHHLFQHEIELIFILFAALKTFPSKPHYSQWNFQVSSFVSQNLTRKHKRKKKLCLIALKIDHFWAKFGRIFRFDGQFVNALGKVTKAFLLSSKSQKILFSEFQFISRKLKKQQMEQFSFLPSRKVRRMTMNIFTQLFFACYNLFILFNMSDVRSMRGTTSQQLSKNNN